MNAEELDRRIRELDGRQPERPPSELPSGVLHGPGLHGNDAVARVEQRIAGSLDALLVALPHLRKRRGFCGGAWQLGVFELPLPGRGAHSDATFSRLVFDLREDPLQHQLVTVDCRSIVHDRNVRSLQLRVDAAGPLDALQVFAQRACAEFGAAYVHPGGEGT